MESEDRDKKGMPTDEGEARYCVLFVQTLKQWEVSEVIRRKLPKDKGVVFYPCVERWIGSLGQTVIQPLFPGYVFIRSTLPRSEIHEYIKNSRPDVLSFIKELRVSRDSMMADGGFDENITDLTASETELLDLILGFRNGEIFEKSGLIETEAKKTEKGKKIYPRRIPKAGVLQMSRGYKDSNDRYVVMEGPLAGREEQIISVNARDRVAWLNLKIGGKQAKVGLELMSKSHWYPKDRNAPVVLEDGSVINPNNVAAEIMRPKG